MTDPNKPDGKDKISVAPLAPDAQDVKDRRKRIETTSSFGWKLKDHVMSRTDKRPWINYETGEDVGFNDSKGKDIQGDLERKLEDVGELAYLQEPEDLPENLVAKLKEASDCIEVGVMKKINTLVVPVVNLLKKMQSQIVDIDGNPDYLIQFTEGGDFKRDLVKSLKLMMKTKEYNAKLTNNPDLDFSCFGRSLGTRMKEIDGIRAKDPSAEKGGVEFIARMDIHEELRHEIVRQAKEIIDMAKLGAESEEIAKKMTVLLSGHLNNLYNGIAGQIIMSFNDPGYEAGDTDASTLQASLKGLKKSLEALQDMKKTAKIIPSFQSGI